jgi:hypothetical protein
MAAQDQIARAVFIVAPVEGGGWAVEHQGALTNRSSDKAETIASAHRLARAAMSGGQAVQVRIDGEAGYF